MSWILAALQVLLGGVMLIAATGKLLSSDEFLGALRLSHLPEAIVRVAAVGVPVVEALLALALVLTPAGRLPLAFAATAGLLAIFTLWMAWIRARRLYVRCGCFGASGGEVGARTIGRNVVLLALAAVGWGLATVVATPLPAPSLPVVMTWVSLGMALALLHALRTVLPRLILTSRGLRGGTPLAWEGE